MSSDGLSHPNTKPSATFPVAVGQVLAGKYKVENVLGIGGMGLVVAAQHVQLGQRVALKFLNDEVCALPQAVDRFMREARASVQIQSEHVARVTDVGQLENGSPYIVMEYLEGTDLAAVLRDRGPLPVEEAVDYVLQAAEAIAVAHRLRIVHRDLKPANLFLTQRPDESSLVKVLDFGISKALDGSGGALSGLTTNSSVNVIGSPLYMSPEQFKSAKDVDTRSDIWALGVILHELVTCAYPFHAETLPQLFAMVLTDPPRRLRDVRPDVPEELEEIVLRCLEKDIDKRYQQVGDLAEALAPLAPAGAQLCVDRIRRVAKASMPPKSTSQPPSASNMAAADANPTLRTAKSNPPPPLASTPKPVNATLAMATPKGSSSSAEPLASSNTTTDAKAWGSTQPPNKRSIPLATAALAAIIPLTILSVVAFGIHRVFGGTSTPASASTSGEIAPPATTTAPALPSTVATASATVAEPTPSASAAPPAASDTSESNTAASAASASAAPAASAAPRPTMTAAAKPKPSASVPSSDGFSDRK